jgi:hypothetical protein
VLHRARKRPVTVNRLPAVNCVNSVGVTGFRLNPALAAYLRERAEGVDSVPAVEPPAGAPPSYVTRRWRIADRLSEEQIAALIDAFVSGTPKHVLAKRYGVSLTAIKDLLRAHGVRGKNRGGRRDRRSG